MVLALKHEPETSRLNNLTAPIRLLKCETVTLAVVQVMRLLARKNFTQRLTSILTALVDGIWSPWSQWSSCTTECNGGQRTRSRQCNQPAAACNGAPCEGSPLQAEPCNTEPCSGITCTDGKVLSNCSNACETSCSTLKCNAQCSEPERCEKGCVCGNGTVMDSNGNCVTPSACQCTYQGRTLLPGQTINVAEKCQEWYAL